MRPEATRTDHESEPRGLDRAALLRAGVWLGHVAGLIEVAIVTAKPEARDVDDVIRAVRGIVRAR